MDEWQEKKRIERPPVKTDFDRFNRWVEMKIDKKTGLIAKSNKENEQNKNIYDEDVDKDLQSDYIKCAVCGESFPDFMEEMHKDICMQEPG